MSKQYKEEKALLCLFHHGTKALEKFLVKERDKDGALVVYGLCFTCLRLRKNDTKNFNLKIDATLGAKLDKLNREDTNVRNTQAE